MSKFDDIIDYVFPTLGAILGVFIIVVGIGSCGHYNQRYNMKEVNIDREYFFTTKQVGSHEILIVSHRYDDKSFQIVDLGESTVKAEQ
jgi:hypothetical protein